MTCLTGHSVWEKKHPHGAIVTLWAMLWNTLWDTMARIVVYPVEYV